MGKPQVRIPITSQDKSKAGFKSAAGNMQQLKLAAQSVTAALGPLAVAAAAVGAAVGLKNLVSESIDGADRIQKLSQQLDISTEALSQYQHVAELTGTTFPAITKGLAKMQKNLGDASDGLSTAKRSFKDLGLEVDDLRAMKPEEAFELIGEEIYKLEDPSKRTQLALNIFGKAGAELKQTFSEGASGVREMREEADALGLTLKDSTAQGAARVKDSMTRFDTSIDGVKVSLLTALIPAMEKISPVIENIADEIGEASTEFTTYADAMFASSNLIVKGMNLFNSIGDPKDKISGVETAIWDMIRAQIKLVDTEVGLDFSFLLGEDTELGPVKVPVVLDFDNSVFKDFEVPESWGHEQLMESMDEVQLLEVYWGNVKTQYDATAQASVDATATMLDGLFQTVDATEDLSATGEHAMSIVEDAAADAGSGIESAIHHAVVAGKLELEDLARVAKSVLGSIIGGLIRLGIGSIIPGPIGAMISGVPFTKEKAMGGPVAGGTPYLVGEKGPELFTPNSTGNITPNHKLGGGLTISTLHVSIAGTISDDPLSVRRAANLLYDELLEIAAQHGPTGAVA